MKLSLTPPSKPVTAYNNLASQIAAAFDPSKVPTNVAYLEIKALSYPHIRSIPEDEDEDYKRDQTSFNKWESDVRDCDNRSHINGLVLYGPSDISEFDAYQRDNGESLETALEVMKNLGPYTLFDGELSISSHKKGDEFAIFRNFEGKLSTLYFKDIFNTSEPCLHIGDTTLKWPKPSVLVLQNHPDECIIKGTARLWLRKNTLLLPAYPLFSSGDRLVKDQASIKLVYNNGHANKAPSWSTNITLEKSTDVDRLTSAISSIKTEP